MTGTTLMRPHLRLVLLVLSITLICTMMGYVSATNLPDFQDEDGYEDYQRDPSDYHDSEQDSLASDDFVTSASGGEPVIKARPLLDLNNLKPMDLWFEILMVLVAALYMVLYTYGKRINKELARTWMRGSLQMWQSQFSHVGSNEGHRLIGDGPRDYVFYASGRSFVKHVYGYVRLVARHDIIQWVLDYFLGLDQYDKVTLTFTLNDKIADPFIFAILPCNVGNSIKAKRWDLENEVNGTPIKEPLIDEIILTDIPKVMPEKVELLTIPRTLTLTYRIPNNSNTSNATLCTVEELNQLGIDLVDYVGQRGDLRPEGKARVTKLRQAAEAAIFKSQEESRKEERSKKKIKEKKEKEEQVAKLSPEEQRKYEEKERKRELKKSNTKMKKRGKATKM
ncbi:hypothetical protein BSLG_001719 [Batrachochytrium salamandrivorans]|nr:hypothetical protein BSLG_001719 [Batrachochytrium salamandrivorans]